jgi:[NiFe] hydrogenase diaphorase moiety large subunit
MLVEEKNALTEEIEQLIKKFGKKRSALLSILHDIQIKHRHISDYAQQEIARLLDIHPVEVYSVLSFFAFLNANPKGRNIIRVCQTISCDMKGKDNIVRAIERELSVKVGQTTSDNKFTLEYVNCLGLCDEGPAMAINDQVYTKLTPEKAVKILSKVK